MDSVGGFRLVRKLGEGDRAEVWLGHSDRHDTTRAAVKLYRAGTPDDQIDIELEALARCDSPHLLRLDDVGTAPDGRPCLVLPRLGGSVARLLGSRSRIGVGEFVTATAPIVAAVQELRRIGVVHGALGPGSVLLDERGAPVVVGFGYARLVGPAPIGADESSLTPAERDAEGIFAQDLTGLSRYVESLAVRATDRHGLRPPAVDELLAWCSSMARSDAPSPAAAGSAAASADDLLEELGGRLFDLGPATPIREEDRASASIARARAVPVSAPAADLVRPLRPSPKNWVQGLMDHVDTHPLDAIRSRVGARLRTALAPVRTPVWVAGGVGLAALVAGMVVVPALGGADDTGGEGNGRRGSMVDAPSVDNSAAPRRTEPSATARQHSSETTGNPSGSPAQDSAASLDDLNGDDPVAAAAALIATRARCLSARDALCLDGVDQPLSAALEADRYAVRTTTGAATRSAHPLPASPIALVQLLGDSAIIGLGEATATDEGAAEPPQTYPASILIVKTTNGWRIRDLTTGVSP